MMIFQCHAFMSTFVRQATDEKERRNEEFYKNKNEQRKHCSRMFV